MFGAGIEMRSLYSQRELVLAGIWTLGLFAVNLALHH